MCKVLFYLNWRVSPCFIFGSYVAFLPIFCIFLCGQDSSGWIHSHLPYNVNDVFLHLSVLIFQFEFNFNIIIFRQKTIVNEKNSNTFSGDEFECDSNIPEICCQRFSLLGLLIILVFEGLYEFKKNFLIFMWEIYVNI